jgi:hypothetical protein
MSIFFYSPLTPLTRQLIWQGRAQLKKKLNMWVLYFFIIYFPFVIEKMKKMKHFNFKKNILMVYNQISLKIKNYILPTETQFRQICIKSKREADI